MLTAVLAVMRYSSNWFTNCLNIEGLLNCTALQREPLYLFAGEQRDSETGLDYLRARYYDPFLGRFISADAYEGKLNDPLSLHDYLYAHANPVVNTDPSGYFSIQELLGTIAGYSVLAGLSFTTGAAIGTVAGGGSAWDAVALYDQFFAGLVDSLTFGISSEARRLAYGETATANHKGLFFNLGRLGGAIASAWVGSFAATFKTLGSAPWWARAALGYDLFDIGIALTQRAVNVLQGRATWWDIVPLLQVLVWGGTTLKLNSRGIKYGPNGNNLEIAPGTGSETPLFRDFFHGSSRESIESIVNHGLDTGLARSNSGGGRVNRPGSFFAIEVSEPEAMQLAYEFGRNRTIDYNDVRILVMRVPESTIRDLEINELIIRRPIAGADTTMETIFRPESFETLNRVVEFPQIIVPGGSGGR